MRISSRKRRKMIKARLAKKYIVPMQNTNYSQSEENEQIIKQAWVDLSNNEIINDEKSVDDHEEINDVDDDDHECKCKYLKILGCGKYDAKPPICCRLLKRIGICYMLKRYFKKRSRRIYPHLNEA